MLGRPVSRAQHRVSRKEENGAPSLLEGIGDKHGAEGYVVIREALRKRARWALDASACERTEDPGDPPGHVYSGMGKPLCWLACRLLDVVVGILLHPLRALDLGCHKTVHHAGAVLQ